MGGGVVNGLGCFICMKKEMVLGRKRLICLLVSLVMGKVCLIE